MDFVVTAAVAASPPNVSIPNLVDFYGKNIMKTGKEYLKKRME